jgi:hypothetical protein
MASIKLNIPLVEYLCFREKNKAKTHIGKSPHRGLCGGG